MYSKKGETEQRTLSDSLDETCQHKCKIVARVKSMPESTRDERRHAGSKPRFLTLRRHSKVYIVTQPIVGIDVPVTQICSSVLRGFHAPWANILESIPADFSCNWIYSFVTET